MSMKPFTVLATGPSATAAEFEPLRAAGLDLVIGRPLDAPDRRPWSEADLIEAVRAADVVLASHLELISRSVLTSAERLQLVIVPFIGVDKITEEPLPADSALRRVDPERMILTPHNVAHSEAGRVANLKLALDQILALARGEVPAHVVNPDAVARWRARRG
jgi:phosphoglycerate dehydrogenase-like enzyme